MCAGSSAGPSSPVSGALTRIEETLNSISLGMELSAVLVKASLYYTKSNATPSCAGPRDPLFRENLRSAYFGEDAASCMVTGVPDAQVPTGRGQGSNLVAGHVAGISKAGMWNLILKLTERELNTPRNGVFWLRFFEELFSDSRAIFVYSREYNTFVTHVIDADMLDTPVAPGGPTLRAYDGEPWTFRFEGPVQPYKRAFSAHAVLALERATLSGYLRDGYHLDRFADSLEHSGVLKVRCPLRYLPCCTSPLLAM